MKEGPACYPPRRLCGGAIERLAADAPGDVSL